MYGLTVWVDVFLQTRKERAIEDELERMRDAGWERELEDLLSGSS